MKDRVESCTRSLNSAGFRLLSGRLPTEGCNFPNGPDGRDAQPTQPATISRTIANLIAKGVIVRSGRTKGSRFALTEAARHFAASPRVRPPLAFDPLRIQAYQPSVTTWLPSEFRERMHRVTRGVRGRIDASAYSRKIAEHFIVDLSWASSQLEGNTYDFLDTEILIRYGQEVDGPQSAIRNRAKTRSIPESPPVMVSIHQDQQSPTG
ncbi:MAG: hypothetical protein OXC91_09865 [Rhodobacteraceae bacterium]|nr:hypothetical protein [Paracoccaceae bacterium]